MAAVPAPLAAQQHLSVSSHDTVVVTGRRTPGCASGDLPCLDAELKAAAKRPALPAIGATAAEATTPSRVGTFSHTATAQRMGRNFGRSAQPYRPAAPAYTSTVTGARAR
ncbi:MAG: hypothetical protein V4610_15745 [Pseudomonadota bacterium]|jgi:hypothetical protein